MTNVSQLRDIAPTDWAYEALRSLVERYGCIAGYPDGTYRGDRALTRWEFAAGLNSCLKVIERLLQEPENVGILGEDIEKLQRLTQEFEAELAALGTRIDNLEGRVASLEDHQFSTTTKLQGESSISVTSAFGREKAGGGDLDEIPVLQQRTRLILNTSFTGKDLLKMFLNSGTATPFGPRITGTNMTQLNFPLDTNSSVVLGKMFYRFSPSDNLKVYIDAFRFGLTYVRSFYPENEVLVSGGTDSQQANHPFGLGIPTSADHTGLQFSYRISPSLIF